MRYKVLSYQELCKIVSFVADTIRGRSHDSLQLITIGITFLKRFMNMKAKFKQKFVTQGTTENGVSILNNKNIDSAIKNHQSKLPTMNILIKTELLHEFKIRDNPTLNELSSLLERSDFLLSQKYILLLNNILTDDYKEALHFFDKIFEKYAEDSSTYILSITNENEKIKEIKSLVNEMIHCKVGLHLSSYTQNMTKNEKIKDFIQTRDYSFNKNELNDFICLSLGIKAFDDINMNHFINIINTIKEDTEENKKIIKNNLSYIHILHLGYFCFIISNFINSIEFKETLSNNYQKRGYYYTHFIEFLNILDNSTILDLAKGYLNINVKDSKAVKKDKIFQDEKNSHYIQGAFLQRIIGEKMKFNNADKLIIKDVKKPDLDNPYCILYIYGTTINEADSQSIENKLAHGIESYFNNFLDYIQINEIRKSYSFRMGSKIKLYQELNLYLILNYIRTPIFIDDLVLSFNIFLQRKTELLFKEGSRKMSEILINTLNPFENHQVFKSLQIIFIEVILENIKNKNLFSQKDILSKINQYTKESQYLKEFLKLVINKLYVFRNSCWEYEVLDKEINTFSDNLFILGTRINKELFENSDDISLAYFPINKNKILFFKNNKQYSKDLFNYVIKKENIMLASKRNKFIVQSI